MNFIRNRKTQVIAGVTAVVATAQSHAALGTAEQGVYDSVTALVGDHSTAALALLTVILGAFIGMKLLKKFVNRAS